MRTRHKPPALVSMWMLDVFCCALGCVTLLWLLNTREAAENASRAGSALTLLAATEADLKATKAELLATKAEFDQTKRKLNSEVEDLRAKLLATTDERDDASAKLALAQGDLKSAEQKLTAAVGKTRDLTDELTKKQREAREAAARAAVATQSADELMKLLREKERERDALALRSKAAEEQLNDLDARLKSVAKAADDAKADLAAARRTGDELANARAAVRDLSKKLDDANANLIDLQGQKAKLADKYDKLRVESDARFAGIAMTGRRVCFVVDTSGSMKLLDDKTPAPDKWPTVCDTVARVMRSLPDLTQFQVVTFSRKADYLFGTGEWQTYRGETSARQVAEALRRVDPAGDTNLYDALDLAFRLKPTGLDTVYLFSDGLPTSGPGLTPAEEKSLADSARTDKLTRHVRQTLLGSWNRAGAAGRVKVNAVGFFFESPEVGAFLWALARENDGSFVGMSRP
ncbi:MAG: VWA domain-containing protein [Gemmataceae bacterium]